MPDDYAVRVGEAVKQRLGSRTQKALAAVLGYGEDKVSRRIKGTTPFTVDELARIEEWLDLPPGQIMRDAAGEHGDSGRVDQQDEIARIRRLLEDVHDAVLGAPDDDNGDTRSG